MRPRFLILVTLVFAMTVSCDHAGRSAEEKAQDEHADSLGKALNSPELKDVNRRILDDPSNAALYNERARIYISLKRAEDAVNDGSRAVRLDSSKAEHYLTLADAYFARNATRQARDLLEQTAHRFPNNVEALLKLAELHFLVRQYQEAINDVNKALKIDEHNAKGYYIKGSVYRESGDTARAISSLETAIEQNNRYEEAFYDLGVLYGVRKNPLAFEYYDNVIRINPANQDVLYARAKLLQDLNRDDEAIAEYEKLVKSANGCPNCCYNLGAIYLERKKDTLRAIEWFTKAIEAEPQYAEAYFARGYAYSLLGKKSEARADYKKCLSIAPSFTPAVDGLNQL